MAKKIVWSHQAKCERLQILSYWIEKTRSKSFSIRLNNAFKDAALLISRHTNIGRKTDYAGIRSKVVLKDYQIFYENKGTDTHILSIWDNRQNPKLLQKNLKNIKK